MPVEGDEAVFAVVWLWLGSEVGQRRTRMRVVTHRAQITINRLSPYVAIESSLDVLKATQFNACCEEGG